MNGSVSAQFYYDGKNRQIARNTNGVIRFNSWDGWDLLEEYSSSLDVATAYLQGPTGVIKSWSAANTLYYYQDKLGSTTHVANASGQLVESYHYDLTGTPTETSTHGVVDLYAGERWIPELALYDLRNRFMSPELGRFLQTDPIGFQGDASNLYRYCGNDPVDRTDPTGLVTEWQRQMLWQGGGEGGIWEQIQRMDQATGLSSPSASGHVVIESPYVKKRDVDQVHHDSQAADVVDDEHFGDHGGGTVEGQPPGLTTGHPYVSDRGVVRSVVDSQYGRYFVASDGTLRPYGPKWSAAARSGENDHQVEIREAMSPAKLQARADRAFARGGVKELRAEMAKAMSNAVGRSGLQHDGPSGDHHLRRPIQRFPYSESVPYDQ
jgi:RHS repeat-associated protein